MWLIMMSFQITHQTFTKNAFYLKIQGRKAKVENQEPFAHSAPESLPDTFQEAVNILKPSAIIGE